MTAHYPRRVLRLWWVTVLTALLGLGVAAVAYQAETPTYQAVSQMSIGYQGSTVGDEFAAHNLSIYRAAALADLASRPPVIKRAMAEAGVTGPTPRVVAGAFSSSSLLSIVVMDSDPVRAAKVANGFATVLPAELARLVGPLDQGITVHMTVRAVAPSAPIAPVLKRVLGLGLLVGVVVGLIAVAIVEALDRTIRDSDQLVRATAGRLVGVVPQSVRSDLLPVRVRPASRRAQGYRNVRAVMAALDARVLAVTSPLSDEGRSTLVANVAVAMVATGQRVLVIEADLRRPMMAEIYGLSREVGLTHVLDGQVLATAAIQYPGGGLPAVLAAGPSTRIGADLFVGSAFEEVIVAVRDEFDCVLIDAPSVEHNASAGVVCRAADATVLLARVGRSTPRHLQSTLASLGANGVQVAGVVANRSRGGSAADAALRSRLWSRRPWEWLHG